MLAAPSVPAGKANSVVLTSVQDVFAVQILDSERDLNEPVKDELLRKVVVGSPLVHDAGVQVTCKHFPT